MVLKMSICRDPLLVFSPPKLFSVFYSNQLRKNTLQINFFPYYVVKGVIVIFTMDRTDNLQFSL